jgi:hypothetical protein
VEPFKPQGWLWRRPRRAFVETAISSIAVFGLIGMAEDLAFERAHHRPYAWAFTFWAAAFSLGYLVTDLVRYALWRRGLVFGRAAGGERPEPGEPRIMRHDS